MEILITNDDGIYAEGIYALAKALGKAGNVTVVAPDTQRSAVGHAITIADPLRVTPAKHNGKFFGYSASGTPADCVKLGIKSIMKKSPDLVVSGINLGGNLGYNILTQGRFRALRKARCSVSLQSRFPWILLQSRISARRPPSP